MLHSMLQILMPPSYTSTKSNKNYCSPNHYSKGQRKYDTETISMVNTGRHYTDYLHGKHVYTQADITQTISMVNTAAHR